MKNPFKAMMRPDGMESGPGVCEKASFQVPENGVFLFFVKLRPYLKRMNLKGRRYVKKHQIKKSD